MLSIESVNTFDDLPVSDFAVDYVEVKFQGGNSASTNPNLEIRWDDTITPWVPALSYMEFDVHISSDADPSATGGANPTVELKNVSATPYAWSKFDTINFEINSNRIEHVTRNLMGTLIKETAELNKKSKNKLSEDYMLPHGAVKVIGELNAVDATTFTITDDNKFRAYSKPDNILEGKKALIIQTTNPNISKLVTITANTANTITFVAQTGLSSGAPGAATAIIFTEGFDNYKYLSDDVASLKKCKLIVPFSSCPLSFLQSMRVMYGFMWSLKLQKSSSADLLCFQKPNSGAGGSLWFHFGNDPTLHVAIPKLSQSLHSQLLSNLNAGVSQRINYMTQETNSHRGLNGSSQYIRLGSYNPLVQKPHTLYVTMWGRENLGNQERVPWIFENKIKDVYVVANSQKLPIYARDYSWDGTDEKYERAYWDLMQTQNKIMDNSLMHAYDSETYRAAYPIIALNLKGLQDSVFNEVSNIELALNITFETNATNTDIIWWSMTFDRALELSIKENIVKFAHVTT